MSGRVWLLACLLGGFGHPALADEESVAMRTIEGQVISIGQFEGESHLEVVMVSLATGGQDEPPVEILLAPETVCSQIGFEIRMGDRLRARVFLDDGPQRVQKIQNLTRGTMVRMRTLHSRPLWNAVGAWYGGPMRTDPARHRHRGGRGEGPS